MAGPGETARVGRMPAGTKRRRLRGRDRARAATTRRIHRPSRAITRSEAALPPAGGDEHGQALARELHEEMGNLAVLKHSLSLTSGNLAKGRTVEAARSLEESVILLTEVITSLRHVVVGLHPPLLDEVGFPAAVRHTLRQFARRTGIKVRLQGRGLAAPLPPPHQAALYRALQGALSNVVRHSRAASVTVTAAVGAGPTMVMTIEDDGVGFNTRGRAPALSFGLRSMRERMETLGGQLRVRSQRAADGARGCGTRIALRLPFPAPRA